MFYVYEWYNTKTNEVFYVGKGSGKRNGQISQRNLKFQEYFNNHICANRIVQYFENEQDAFEFEHNRIIELKDIGQATCNLDNGGKGGVNFVWTPEMREYYSENNVMKRPEQRQRMIEQNPMKDPIISKKVADANKKPIYVGDILYDGLIDAANAYNTTSQAFSYWLKRGYTNDYKVCYYDGDTKPELHILTHQSTKAKSVIIDGIYYPSVRAAAQAIGGSASSLSRAIREHRTFKGHTCEYGNQQPT